MEERPPVALRDLEAMDVGIPKGVGPKKDASLHSLGIDNLLDVSTT